MCNAHTHGLERYGHLDFQMVLLPTEEIGRILNTLGLRVQSGERFRSGDMVSGIMKTAMCAWMSMKRPGARFAGHHTGCEQYLPRGRRLYAPILSAVLKTDELCVERGIQS